MLKVLSFPLCQVADILIRYLDLAIEHAPVNAGTGTASRSDLRTSHFKMMAGVCIEYCVEIGRLDLLFGDVFSSFVAVNEVSSCSVPDE